MGSAPSPSKRGRKAGQDAGKSEHRGAQWSPMPLSGRRGGNLRKERDEYYRHLAAHPDGKDYLAGFRRPTNKTAGAAWSFLKPRLKLNIERILPPKRTRREGDELTAKQALVVAFDAAVGGTRTPRFLIALISPA